MNKSDDDECPITSSRHFKSRRYSNPPKNDLSNLFPPATDNRRQSSQNALFNNRIDYRFNQFSKHKSRNYEDLLAAQRSSSSAYQRERYSRSTSQMQSNYNEFNRSRNRSKDREGKFLWHHLNTGSSVKIKFFKS